jgi:hypothetical protein
MLLSVWAHRRRAQPDNTHVVNVMQTTAVCELQFTVTSSRTSAEGWGPSSYQAHLVVLEERAVHRAAHAIVEGYRDVVVLQ